MKAKKIMSMLLGLTLSTSVLAACGTPASTAGTTAAPAATTTKAGETTAEGTTAAPTQSGITSEIDMNEEPFTVAIQVVTLPGTAFEGTEDREAAINAIMEPAINAKIDIQEVWISELNNTTTMAVAGGEKIDLVHVGTVQKLSSMVGQDLLYDMNTENLLQNRGQELVAIFGEKIKSGYVKGQQLAVPARVFNASAKGFSYNKDLADKHGIIIPEKGDFDVLGKALKDIKAAEPDMIPFYTGSGELNFLAWMGNFDGFGSEASYGVIFDAEKEAKVENLYASDYFKDYVLRMWQWKQDGLISGDTTDTRTTQELYAAEQLFTTVVGIEEMQKLQYASRNPFESAYVEMVPVSVSNGSLTEYMWGIATNSERPDKAMDVLNFIYKNSEVANILNFGLKDVNYTMVEGSEVSVQQNGTYLPIFLRIGNTAEMMIQAPANEETLVNLRKMEDEAKVSEITFYMFDNSEFGTETSVIASTIKEYLPRLQSGTEASEEATLALLEEFKSKLIASGIDDVIAANQAQLDAFLAQ